MIPFDAHRIVIACRGVRPGHIVKRARIGPWCVRMLPRGRPGVRGKLTVDFGTARGGAWRSPLATGPARLVRSYRSFPPVTLLSSFGFSL